MANGDLIKQVREQLSNPNGLTAKQAQVMTLSLLADLYEKWESDHAELERMKPVVSAVKWFGAAFGLTNITIWVGIFTHTFHFP